MPEISICLAQALQKHLTIFWIKKDRLPFVATLDDVIGMGWQVESRLTGHVGRPRRLLREGPYFPMGATANTTTLCTLFSLVRLNEYLGLPLENDLIVVIDKLWQNVTEPDWVCRYCTIVEFDMAIGADAHDVAWLIWPIVWFSKWLDVMRLGIWGAITKYYATGTYLTGMAHVGFYAAS